MPEYYKNSIGIDTFSVKEAKRLVDKMNKVSSKFGVNYKVERCGMTTAKIIREGTEGGQSKKRVKRKRGGKC